MEKIGLGTGYWPSWDLAVMRSWDRATKPHAARPSTGQNPQEFVKGSLTKNKAWWETSSTTIEIKWETSSTTIKIWWETSSTTNEIWWETSSTTNKIWWETSSTTIEKWWETSSTTIKKWWETSSTTNNAQPGFRLLCELQTHFDSPGCLRPPETAPVDNTMGTPVTSREQFTYLSGERPSRVRVRG